MRRPDARLARNLTVLAAGVAVAAGLGVGGAMLIAEDIGGARRNGTVAPAGAPVAYQPAPSEQPDDIADSYGFAAAAQTNAQRDADCARMQPAFRRGCRNYLNSR